VTKKHDAIGVRVWQGSEQDTIDDAENGGVHANA
jgi:hypothetical protein